MSDTTQCPVCKRQNALVATFNFQRGMIEHPCRDCGTPVCHGCARPVSKECGLHCYTTVNGRAVCSHGEFIGNPEHVCTQEG